MHHSKSLVIKLGSQTIINQQGELDIPQLESLVLQIITLKNLGYHVLLVSSGAVATGRGSTKNMQLKFKDIVEERQTYASIGQARLIEIYNTILKQKGFIAAQILLTKEDFRKRTHYLNTYHLLKGLIQNKNVLPIINENDVTSINELMFTDNDELSALVAVQMDAKQLIILTSIDGVYDQDPTHPKAKIISTLDLNHTKDWPSIGSSKTIYGRGGMLSKLASARKAAHFGIQTHIVNAKIPDAILKIVVEKEILGTQILPYKKDKGIKRWLAHTHSDSLPCVTINQGISDILSQRLKAVSLLPIGILSVKGEFEKGELVSIKTESGKALGLGIAGYNSETLLEVIGKKDQKAFIHYNKISLFDSLGEG